MRSDARMNSSNPDESIAFTLICWLRFVVSASIPWLDYWKDSIKLPKWSLLLRIEISLPSGALVLFSPLRSQKERPWKSLFHFSLLIKMLLSSSFSFFFISFLVLFVVDFQFLLAFVHLSYLPYLYVIYVCHLSIVSIPRVEYRNEDWKVLPT